VVTPSGVVTVLMFRLRSLTAWQELFLPTFGHVSTGTGNPAPGNGDDGQAVSKTRRG
jgi:hypothetical protein